MTLKACQLLLLSIYLTGCVSTGQIKSSAPESPDLKAKYLFWMHGIDLENRGPDSKRAKNNDKIIESLAGNGFFVITEHRDVVIVEIYAVMIAEQVNQLLKKGVPPKNITVGGYSKGSLIAAATSTELANSNINYIFVSGCTDRHDLSYSNVKGRILSIYDKGDDGWFSCADRININDDAVEFKEIAIVTGKGHKGFRLPNSRYRDQWQTPLFNWVK